MKSIVAAVDLRENRKEAVQNACDLIGGIEDIDVPEREVVVKVGVFTPAWGWYSTVDTVRGILQSFRHSPKRYIVETDNYRGDGMKRLQIWKELFSDNVVPVNLSNESDTVPVEVPNPVREVVIDLSRLVMKPRVFVDTHVMRSYERGSILKNLFGLPPTSKKVQYHRSEIFYPLLTALYEAIGGIDLAVLDATYMTHSFKEKTASVQTDLVLVGRDAVAVEALGLHLAGVNVAKNELIKSFTSRRLGVGDLDDIDVVGMPIEELEKRFKQARRECELRMSKIPDAWSPSKAVDQLIASGYFISSKGWTLDEIVAELARRDPGANGREKMVYASVRRRADRGRLRTKKVGDKTVYQA